MNSQVPIMLDYYDASKPSTELVTTFLDCEFRVSFSKAIYSIHCGISYFLYVKYVIVSGLLRFYHQFIYYYNQISN